MKKGHWVVVIVVMLIISVFARSCNTEPAAEWVVKRKGAKPASRPRVVQNKQGQFEMVPKAVTATDVPEAPAIPPFNFKIVDWVTEMPISGTEFKVSWESSRKEEVPQSSKRPSFVVATSDAEGAFTVQGVARMRPKVESIHEDKLVVMKLEQPRGKSVAWTVLCFQSPIRIHGTVAFESPDLGSLQDVVVTYGISPPEDRKSQAKYKGRVSAESMHTSNVHFSEVKPDASGNWELLVPRETSEVTVCAIFPGCYLSSQRVGVVQDWPGVKFCFTDSVKLILEKGKRHVLEIRDASGNSVGPATFDEQDRLVGGALVTGYIKWRGKSAEYSFPSQVAISDVLGTAVAGVSETDKKGKSVDFSAQWNHVMPPVGTNRDGDAVIDQALNGSEEMSFLVVTKGNPPQLFHVGEPIVIKGPDLTAPAKYKFVCSKYPECSFSGAWIKLAWQDTGITQAPISDTHLDAEGALSRDLVVPGQRYDFICRPDGGRSFFHAAVVFGRDEVVDIVDCFLNGELDVPVYYTGKTVQSSK